MVSICNSCGRSPMTDAVPADQEWTDPTCPVARTVDLVGDRWSLLIVRDAMDGAASFTDFRNRLGVARNILSDRLRKLTAHGILATSTPPGPSATPTGSPTPARSCSPPSSRSGSGENAMPSPPARTAPSWSTTTDGTCPASAFWTGAAGPSRHRPHTCARSAGNAARRSPGRHAGAHQVPFGVAAVQQPPVGVPRAGLPGVQRLPARARASTA